MYPPNLPPQETQEPQAKATAAAPSPLIPTVPQKTQIEQVKNTAVTFVKTGVIIAIALIVFHWANANYKLGDRLNKVNTEVWIGLIATIATTYWTWYSEREKDKIKLAQENAATNRGLVATLESRIDSVLLQIAALRSSIARSTQQIEKLIQDERNLDEKIDQYRYDVLQERLEIVRSFYQEICNLHSSVSYLKGFKDGDRPVSVDKINEILAQIATQVKTFEDSTTVAAPSADEETGG